MVQVRATQFINTVVFFGSSVFCFAFCAVGVGGAILLPTGVVSVHSVHCKAHRSRDTPGGDADCLGGLGWLVVAMMLVGNGGGGLLKDLVR